MRLTSRTSGGIAYDRTGQRGDPPVVLIHAGVADRRMWDPIWPGLTADHDAVRLDLRGFGESVERPDGALSPVDDVLTTLDELDIAQYHLVGASFGAGVAVEASLTQPETVLSLLLSPPAGSLLATLTPDLRAFFDAERSALDRGDLDSAVEANLSWWVEGLRRRPGDVDSGVRDRVREMQRRAFEVTAGWEDVDEIELDPPALDRLTEIRIPTLILLGALDLDAVQDTARRVADGIASARLIEWPDTGHLPSMERPEDFVELLRDWLTSTRPAR